VLLPGISGGAPRLPYPICGGTSIARLQPFDIAPTPTSHPLITSPTPTRKLCKRNRGTGRSCHAVPCCAVPCAQRDRETERQRDRDGDEMGGWGFRTNPRGPDLSTTRPFGPFRRSTYLHLTLCPRLGFGPRPATMSLYFRPPGPLTYPPGPTAPAAFGSFLLAFDLAFRGSKVTFGRTVR